MNEAIIIRGLGLVTPLGLDAAETWKSLLDGKTITTHSSAPGQFDQEPTPVSAIALSAARQAIHSSKWGLTELSSDRTALVVGTSKGAVESWIPSAEPTSDNRAVGDLDPIGLHTVASTLAHALGLTGHAPRLTLSSACATGLHALIRAALLLQQGDADRAIVVAAESSLSPLFIQSYRRLGVLTPPGELTRPFDVNRSGFLVSEAAAAICIERANPQPADEHNTAEKRAPDGSMGQGDAAFRVEPSAGDVVIDRFAWGADAHHLTGNNPTGAVLQRLIGQCIAEEKLHLIHAHGTATRMNDQIELAAIEAALPEAEFRPLIYSHKGALGHTLGAAGLVAIALNIVAHRTGQIPPNPNTLNPMQTTRVKLCGQKTTHGPPTTSLAIAAGFGGAIAVVRLKHVAKHQPAGQPQTTNSQVDEALRRAKETIEKFKRLKGPHREPLE